jgi:2-methylisocitrate lyase-like PEP mutase family enzyme/nucleoside-diphosphate-sugar epimerase
MATDRFDSLSEAPNQLLTGAAGFLGSYIAIELLERTDSHLHLLVRSRPEERGAARVRARLLRSLVDSGHTRTEAEQRLNQWSARLHVIEADLCELGASLGGLRKLDQVWHVAGVMHFAEEKRGETFATNVEGTRALLEQLRGVAVSAFNFVSTAYVAGSASGPISEGPARVEIPACNPYEESKREAEQLVVDACAARGIRSRILRPSIILGDSRTGRADSNVGLYGILNLLARLRRTVTKHIPDHFEHNIVKIPAPADMTLNFIAVDHVARVMADVALNPDAEGYIHVASPSTTPISWMMDCGGEAFAMQMKPGYKLSELNPAEYVMMSKMQLFDCYMNQPKEFALDACMRLCPESIRAAALDHATYKKMVDAWVAEHLSLTPAASQAPPAGTAATDAASVTAGATRQVARGSSNVAPRSDNAFRTLLEAPGVIALPGCFDVLSAILLEQTGFRAVFVSGYGVAASLLGSPDVGLTSLTETLDVARRITAQVKVPLVLDLDNGYGDIANTVRSIRGAEAAGVAAVQLEDQILPKQCGHAEGKKVHDVDTFLRKLEAALDARERGLCVIARTDSTDIDDAIRRARRYREAGADATIVDGLRSESDIRRVGQEVPGPKQLNLIYGGKTPLITLAQAEQFGFKIVLYSTPLLYAATWAMARAADVLLTTGDLSALSKHSVSFQMFQPLLEAHHQRAMPPARPSHAPANHADGTHAAAQRVADSA